MPVEAALLPIYLTLKTELAACVALTALLGTKPAAQGGGAAVYDEGDDGLQIYTGTVGWLPYVVLGSGTQIPWYTMGASPGWNCTVQVKAAAQATEATVLGVLTAVLQCLTPGRPLPVPGYGSAWCDEVVVQPTLITQQAGKTTRESPLILRVYVHD